MHNFCPQKHKIVLNLSQPGHSTVFFSTIQLHSSWRKQFLAGIEVRLIMNPDQLQVCICLSESLEAGIWWDVSRDVKGQYYDLQLFYGCRCGMSNAAKTAKRRPATPHNTDRHRAPRPPAAKLNSLQRGNQALMSFIKVNVCSLLL